MSIVLSIGTRVCSITDSKVRARARAYALDTDGCASNSFGGKIERGCHSGRHKIKRACRSNLQKIDIGPKQWFYQCNDIKATTRLKYP